MTAKVNEQLSKKPNLDIKTTIAGLEKTLDMACDIGVLSPQVFLESYQPLRMPDYSRKQIEKIVEKHKPPVLCGMVVTSLHVITQFTN